jgi:Fe-S-cluster containining protein
MNANLKSPVFQCRQCGDCCAGRGGIHVQPGEVAAMAALLNLPLEEFQRRYVEPSPLGPRLTTVDGVCVFLLEDHLCWVHPVKPALCRRWPFLSALLAHPEELEYAKTACPGLNPASSHDEFVAAARNLYPEEPII